MSIFQTIWTDLREKRLWPVAVALIAAIVAVPVVLAKTAKEPAPRPTTTSPNSSPLAGLPVVSVDGSAPSGSLKGTSKRDPFSQQKVTSTTSTTAAVPTTTGSGTTGSTGSSGSTTSGGTGGPGATTTPVPTTPTPALTPNPSFTGLTDKQSYHVTVAISDSSGGFSTIDPVVRLSPLPSAKQPLLVELGVLKGGHNVLFVVQPGAIITGPGSCTPGPIDCQILSLAENQTEQLSVQTPSGPAPVGLFSVTGISIDEHSSAASADEARRAVSSAGQSLLDKSTLSALSLFEYDPNAGAVVDLRNLTVGGGS